MQDNIIESSWNPIRMVDVTPEDYEKQVLRWLQDAACDVKDFKASHLERLLGYGGEYEFDIVVEFTIFGGAKIVVLVECKRYKNPVDRDLILVLEAKKQDVGAHKAMIFSTSGFQRGALEYATAHGIATVVFADGRSIYKTRFYGSALGRRLPRFAGKFIDIQKGSVYCYPVKDSYTDIIASWLASIP